MTFSDWFIQHSTDLALSSPFRITRKGYGDTFYSYPERSYMFDGTKEGPIHYWSGLVNGKGRHGNKAPLSIFTVKQGQTYVLHMINTGFAYPYRISIDQHVLTVTESDGHRVKPIQVDSAIIFTGESYNFELTANQRPGRYWIRAVNMRTGVGYDATPDGQVWDALAILQYEGADDTNDPTTQERNCSSNKPCKVLNCPWRIYSKILYPNRICIPVSNLSLDTTFYDPDKIPNTKDDEIHEVFLNFGFPIGAAVNKRRLISPRAPLVQSPSTWGLTRCSRDCDNKGCACTHVIELPPNKTIQVVLMADNRDHYAHPIHIHGHSFQVLKMGYPIQDQTSGKILKPNPDIVCDNDACSRWTWSAGSPVDLNFQDPPLKDTIIVPADGYVVVRLISNNPGYWLVHCHVGNHLTEGMGLIFNESFAHQPPAPPGFPTCGKFSSDESTFHRMLERNKCLLESKKCVQEEETNSVRNDEATGIYILIASCASVCTVFTLVFNVLLWIWIVRRSAKPCKHVF